MALFPSRPFLSLLAAHTESAGLAAPKDAPNRYWITSIAITIATFLFAALQTHGSPWSSQFGTPCASLLCQGLFGLRFCYSAFLVLVFGLICAANPGCFLLYQPSSARSTELCAPWTSTGSGRPPSCYRGLSYRWSAAALALLAWFDPEGPATLSCSWLVSVTRTWQSRTCERWTSASPSARTCASSR